MKNKAPLIILLFVTVTAVLLVVLYVRNESFAIDLIVNDEIALGNVDLSSKKEIRVPLANMGNKNFEVARVYTSCGCLKVAGEEKDATSFTIKRNSTIFVNLIFDPIFMHQKGDSIYHEVYFLTTNPIEKEYKVKITGRIV